MLPGDQGRRRRAVEQLVRHGRDDPRSRGADDRRRHQPQHMAQPVEAEIRTEVTFDQPCREQGFPRVTQSEGEGTPDVPIAREIGHEGRDNGPYGHRPSCIAPKSDQDAR